MKWQKEWNLFLGYIIIGALGASIFCGYWWFAGKISITQALSRDTIVHCRAEFSKLENSQKEALRKMSITHNADNISDNDWQILERAGFVERNFTGKVGIKKEFSQLVDQLLKEKIDDTQPAPPTNLPATTSLSPSTIPSAVIPKQPTTQKTEKEIIKEFPTLKKLFDEDFPNTMRQNADRQLTFGSDPTVVTIPEKVYLDFAAKTKFVGYFIPLSAPSPYSICEFLSEMPQTTINDFDSKAEIKGGRSTEVTLTSSKDLIFSGRVYIYHEYFFHYRSWRPLNEFLIQKVCQSYLGAVHIFR